MEWILYIIGGLILLGFLTEIGLIPEFLGMIGITLGAAFICGIIAWFFDWGFTSGFLVGIYIGLGLYALYCIGRIFDDSYTIEFYEDGTQKKVSERWNGIIGLIMLIVLVLIGIFRHFT